RVGTDQTSSRPEPAPGDGSVERKPPFCKIVHGALAVWAKRLEEGTFEFPSSNSDDAAVEVKATELALILGGIELRSVERRKRYQRPTS
ncbi:MAG: transposase, partial [Planctomycetia bacterium]|nr:transposase [Planctomycetia bacterium]